jgi:8-oxo-dGTP pyrophosphatase MutT (NUDIX family)
MARVSSRRRHAPVVQAVSAGGIVVRHTDEGAEIVLGRRRRERDGSTWSLPKGTPDGDETLEETAIREVQEETGLRVRIVSPVGDIHYTFFQDGRRISKTVHYFLMEATGGDLSQHDREFEDVRWVPLGEAERLMSFPTEREIVGRALPPASAA